MKQKDLFVKTTLVLFLFNYIFLVYYNNFSLTDYASKNAGNIIGQTVEGAVTVADGIINSENEKIDEGLNSIGEAGTNFRGYISHNA